MFVMMNEARLGVGVQGLAMSEVAYQNAATYSKERLQGRALTGPKFPNKPADPIIVHPDVRRTLLTIRAINEAGRALAIWVSLFGDISHRSQDAKEKQHADDMMGLLTPVVKGVLTDYGFNNAVLVDFAHQYRQFPRLACNAACRGRLGTTLGSALQRLARMEVGGDPLAAAPAFAARSPLSYARAIARACVPLQIWWSRSDRIVVDPDRQSRRLLAELRRWNPLAPIEAVEGSWVHTAEMRASARLPYALARFALMPDAFDGRWGIDGARVSPTPDGDCGSRR